MKELKIKIPEWGAKTCVLGIEHKEGEYNGIKFNYNKIYGVSVKTVENGTKDIIVSEEFKYKKQIPPLDVGDIIGLIFNRNGVLEEIVKIE